MYLKRARQRYQDLNQLLNRDNDTKPCTPDQLNSLERHLELSVPKAHQEFLLWVGQGSKYFDSDNCRLSDVWNGRETAIEIMKEFNFPGSLPKDAIIFIIPHGGYEFGFIRASMGDNPPLNFYCQDRQGGKIEWNKFSNIEEYLLARIESTIRLYQ